MATEPLKRLLIRSIGAASPQDAAQVALGLGVTVPAMLRAFYQAPSTLADELPEPTAVAIAEVLSSLGCEVEVVDQDGPPPAPGPLLDVAVRVLDESRFELIVAAAAAFLGCPDEDTRRLLLASPPVLIGQVSPATVEALRRRLGAGAEVITSDPAAARYDLLLGDCPAPVRARLLTDLRARGIDSSPTGPWLVRDLTKQQADSIWDAHRRVPTLRLANQDFYRFEVVLDGGHPDDAAITALASAGIPADVVPRLFDALPIIVAEELPVPEAKRLLAALAAAGLEAHAALTTFLQLSVHITDWSSPPPARAALVAVGISDPPTAPPFAVGPWPELTARLVRGMLLRAGAEADLADPDLADPALLDASR